MSESHQQRQVGRWAALEPQIHIPRLRHDQLPPADAESVGELVVARVVQPKLPGRSPGLHPSRSMVASPLGCSPVASPTAVAVNCSDLPNVDWLQIGVTQEPLIKFLGKALRHSTAKPMTLVYVTSGSCSNIDALYNKTPIT